MFGFNSEASKGFPQRKPFPYFLLFTCLFCTWLVWKSLTPTLPKLSEPPRLYSNPSREDIREPLLRSIQKARSSIFLCMFGLSDGAILKTLHEKIDQEVPVTIYYDAKGSPDLKKVLSGGELHPIHLNGIMHQKILILDDELVFLGSTNFTTSSLKIHDNLLIALASPTVARFLKEKVPHANGYMKTTVGGQSIELWLLPDPKGHALADLKKKIRTARKSVKIALFTLTHPVLINECIEAKKRGVDVTVVLDMHSSLGASANAVEELQRGGVKILTSQGSQLMHHKLLYIDDHTLVTGSANWTKAAFAKNSDCILILHHLNETQKTFMDRLWHSIATTAKPPTIKPSPLHAKKHN